MAGGLGEVPDLASVDHDSRQTRSQQGPDRFLLIVSGRFKDDPFGGKRPGPGNESVNAGRIVGESATLVVGSDSGVELVFANIDADQKTTHREAPGVRVRKHSQNRWRSLFKLVNAGCVPSDYSNRG